MPRFHFEFCGPEGPPLYDGEGTDLASLEMAKAEARVVVRTVLNQAAADADWSQWMVRVMDADGQELAVIPFADVVGAMAA